LKNVKFRVQPAGQKKTREEGKKRVHAFVCGEIDRQPLEQYLARKVTYNPYENDTFVFIDDNSPASVAPRVILSTIKTDKGRKPVVATIWGDCDDDDDYDPDDDMTSPL